MRILTSQLVEVGAAPHEDAPLLKERLQQKDALLLRLHSRLHRFNRRAGALLRQHALRHLYERRLLPRLLDDDFARREARGPLTELFEAGEKRVFLRIAIEQEMFATPTSTHSNDSCT